MTGSLTFVGLGLYNEDGISLRGIDAIAKADKVFAEFYTSKITNFDAKRVKERLGKEVITLDRKKTEKGTEILERAKTEDVVFITCGDPMIATTHIDLRMEAMKRNIPTSIIHSGSIVTAAPGLLGLQNYKFGRTTTLAYPEKEYFPTSPYDVIQDNQKMGLHTLVLLDIQADRDRYMTGNEGLELLLKMEEIRGERVIVPDMIACVVARAGSPNPLAKADKIRHLKEVDMGDPLHTLVIPGKLNFMEIEALKLCCGLSEEDAKILES